MFLRHPLGVRLIDREVASQVIFHVARLGLLLLVAVLLLAVDTLQAIDVHESGRGGSGSLFRPRHAGPPGFGRVQDTVTLPMQDADIFQQASPIARIGFGLTNPLRWQRPSVTAVCPSQSLMKPNTLIYTRICRLTLKDIQIPSGLLDNRG